MFSMKTVLYVGNNLSTPNNNPSSIQQLGHLLAGEDIRVYLTSSKRNRLWRMLDMLWRVVRLHGRVDVVLIDTYSTLNFYYAFL